MAETIPYKRILLKLSGETLLGREPFGIDQNACLEVASYLKKIHELGIELAVVIGGGNIFRGINLKSAGLPRTPADHMGMLATLLNGIALQQAMLSLGAQTCVMSALECPKVAEPYNWTKSIDYLSKGTIMIFVGGTGNPYFTTDTAAALRASEIQADILFKATKVDGVFNKDPIKYTDATKYQKLTYSQMLAEKLQVMDATAVALCQSGGVPIFVFNMRRLVENDLKEVFIQLKNGTLITE